MTDLFDYEDRSTLPGGESKFEIFIPIGIGMKQDLLDAFARSARFPEYFGNNWDALMDCLLDLSWIDQECIVIVHGDVPLINDPPLCRTYLSLLGAVVSAWEKPLRSDVASSINWRYVEHRLRVTFPSEARSTIGYLMG